MSVYLTVVVDTEGVHASTSAALRWLHDYDPPEFVRVVGLAIDDLRTYVERIEAGRARMVERLEHAQAADERAAHDRRERP